MTLLEDRGTITYPQEWPVYPDHAVAQATELIALGRSFDYDHGPQLAAYERAFATLHDRRHGLALCSGTAGLLSAYSALGIGPGDEVIVPAFTFFSTATPLLQLGAVPVLCDASAPHGTVDAADLAELIGPRTVAIVVCHLFGHPCDMEPIRALADRHGLALVEDCSHAHGATRDGRRVGTWGDVAIFSTGGRKLVSGGMGGVLITDDDDLFARACLLANFRHRTDLSVPPGPYDPFRITGLGGNFRMSPVAAVLAASHLEQLDELVARRAANVGRLATGLAELPGIAGAPVADGVCMGAWYDGVVAIEPDLARDDIVAALKAAGLRVRAPATRPLQLLPVFRGAAPEWSPLAARAARAAGVRNDRPFPVADRLFASWMTLPVNFLTDADGAIVEPYLDVAADVLA